MKQLAQNHDSKARRKLTPLGWLFICAIVALLTGNLAQKVLRANDLLEVGEPIFSTMIAVSWLPVLCCGVLLVVTDRVVNSVTWWVTLTFSLSTLILGLAYFDTSII